MALATPGSGGGGGGGGAGWEVSASLSSSSASRQTVAADNQFEIGSLTFGEKKDNTIIYFIGGAIALVSIMVFARK